MMLWGYVGKRPPTPPKSDKKVKTKEDFERERAEQHRKDVVGAGEGAPQKAPGNVRVIII